MPTLQLPVFTICDRKNTVHDTFPLDGIRHDTMTLSKAKHKTKARKTDMDYVKGCDITVLTKYNLKKVADGRIRIADGLKNDLSYEKLSGMLQEAKMSFVDCNGKTIKDMPTSEIFIMIKKIDRQKYIIG